MRDSSNIVSTAKKALQILHSFSVDQPERRVTDIANSLGMNKSNVSRLLTTLASEGFVAKDPETQKYRLGLSIIPLYEVVTSNIEVRREAEPYLQRLVDEVGETANITVYQDQSIIDVLRIKCKQPVQIVDNIGVLNPVHCTSAGKVFLAYQNEEELKNYINNDLIEAKNNLYSDPVDFLAMLNKVKKQEYAISIEELIDGIATIATPIRDYTGKVKYSLSILGPVHRFNPQDTNVIQKIKRYTKYISESLGYRESW